jgi:Zn-dependent metalloprotease
VHADPDPPGGRDNGALEAALERATHGAARFATGGRGAVTFVGGTATSPLQAARGRSAREAAGAFVERYAPLFGADAAALTADVAPEAGAAGAVRYQQSYNGVPVLAGVVAVQVDGAGAVVSATGEASPDLDVDTNPTIGPSDAAADAIAVTARADSVGPDVLLADPPQLWIYDPALLDDADVGAPRLVWRIDVHTAIGDVDRLVLIDAHTGAVALHFAQVERILNRSVCFNNNLRSLPETCTAPVRIEGGAAVNLGDVDIAYDLSKVVYDFYAAAPFSRNSLDDNGMALNSTVNFCPKDLGEACPYDNAFWNGDQMVYGQGYAKADDIVAHELTHGVTEFTSGLFYYADSGAINESISDVLGELIDQSNALSGPDLPPQKWLIGEDLFPAGLRSMKDPPSRGDPDKMTSPLFYGGLLDDRGVHTNSGVSNKAAFLLTDGGSFNGQTVNAIGPTKTAFIYYIADRDFLTPGSDYRDLANALQQACTNSVGVGGITAADCAQVQKAVTATEMNLRPTKPGAYLTANVCDAGALNGTLFADDMESPGNGAWTFTNPFSGTRWEYTKDSSESGDFSLHATDRSGAASSIATMTGAVSVGPGPTFLRFAHSFSTDFDPTLGRVYDGGVVELSTDGGGTWRDISTLPAGSVVNGYTGTIFSPTANVLAGRPVFGGESPNYQTTRVDLRSLAGMTVKFRFRFATDIVVGGPGWFIDDVSIHTCTSAPTPPLGVVARAANHAAAVSWSAPVYDGGSPITGVTITPFLSGIAQAPIVVPGNPGSFLVTGLVNGANYSFTVAATNAVGTSAPSAMSNVVVPAAVPDAPTNLVAIAGSSSATLVWTAPADNGTPIVSYTVVPVRDGAPLAPVITPGQQTSFVVPHLVGGATYSFTVAATNGVGLGPPSNRSATVVPSADFVPLAPARLLDSRVGQPTVDGQFSGIGGRDAGSVTAVTVAGRGGVAADAVAVALNVTVTEASAPGFVTVFPCGGEPPTASNLNYVVGSTVPNLVVSKVGAGGQVCLFTQAAVHLIADVSGYFPVGSSLVSLIPARLLETRPGQSTVDAQANGVGRRPDAAVTEVQVAGRAGVPADAAAAVLNVTITDPSAPGYATVYPCGGTPPAASNVNYSVGQTIPNAVVTQIGAGGRVCVFTQSATDLVVDVAGYFPATASLVPMVPARLLETRAGPGFATTDGDGQGLGMRDAGSVTEVRVAGRAGVPEEANAAVVNVTVTDPSAPGYATVYPCGGTPPNASNLNYTAGNTVANAVVVQIGAGGTVCVFTQSPAHLIVDLDAYFLG